MMENSTNIEKYRKLAPVYDTFFSGLLRNMRKNAINSLTFKPGSKVLIMGVGTGEDFLYIPAYCERTGIDISDDMLEKAREKAGNENIMLLKMNAENVEFPAGSFDYVILNLILSVAENPQMVLSEASRILKDDGQVLVFDKFIKKGSRISPFRKLINKITSSIGTDINRCFEDILSGIPLVTVRDELMLFKGIYRAILLRKQ